MPTDIIEMFWGCTICNAENKGRFKTCQNCGAPRTEDSPEWMPGDTSPMAAVKDPKLLEKFEGGADWKCVYCGSSQFRADGNCAQCGSPRGDSTKTERTTKPDIPSSRAPSSQAVQADDLPLRKLNYKPWLIAAGCVLTVSLILFLLFRTKIVDAHVASMHWERVVSVDRYQVYHREGWSPDNGAFNTQDLGSRIHHYDHVRVGSHQESYSAQEACGQTCYTTPRSCRSNKNGSATCTGGDRVCNTKYCSVTKYRTVADYRDVPRYQDWYGWDIWDWGHNRDVKSQGNDSNVQWPSPGQIRLNEGLNQGEKEREAGRKEQFAVVFSYDKDDTATYKPKSVDEYEKFKPGARYKIKVSVAGGPQVMQQE
jgi:hypothetical protein